MVQTQGPVLPLSGGSAADSGTDFPPTNPVEIPAEAVEAQLAQGDFGGVGSVIAVTSGGLTINLIFDAAAMAAPASFRAGIQQAAALLTAAISDNITINLKIDYSGTGGGAAAGPDNGQWESYTSVRANLINDATTGDTTFNALPSGSTIQGQSSVAVWNAQLKLWGLLSPNDTTTDDGSATFATDINPNLLVGVALHELTHALGRVPYGTQPDVFDFFRFSSLGTRLFTGGATASAAYFSLNGGSSKLADYGQSSDPSDFLNSGVQGANDPFNEFYTGSTLQTLTAVDLTQLDALGFHLVSATPVTIEALGTTSLVRSGSGYFLTPVSGGTGTQLRFNGTNVIVGQLGGWVPIGAETTGSGYEVAWKFQGQDLYTVWNTDSSGNYVSTPTGSVLGHSAALEALEPSFHQDLNGDGLIGVYTSTIESAGSISLVQNANGYLLNPVGGGTGPQLKFGGAAVVAGQFGGCVPIGAEVMGGGYEVAWKVQGQDLYIVWNTDGSGNYVSAATGAVSGSSAALEALEPGFQQDLNGDGVIGIPTTIIEAVGATSLVQVGPNYSLNPVGGGTGPTVKFGGSAVVAGQFGGWVPIAAEATGGGYEVAWKVQGVDLYIVWNTDSSGNYIGNPIGAVSGSSSALEALEPSFHQDLNGDGTIGIPTISIEALGSTNLVQVGSNYFLNPVAGGTGPELKFGGTNVVAGQFGGWVPIGAEVTGSGYEVAWKVQGVDLYIVWNIDSSGNYVGNPIGAVPGASAALEALEPTFHQDLNGDGTIGIPAHSSPAGAEPTTQGAQATLDGSALTLATSSDSRGPIIGFDRGSIDQIDPRGVSHGSPQTSFDGGPSGPLSVAGGATAAHLQFMGASPQDSFHFVNDGAGGPVVYATSTPLPATAGQSSPASLFSDSAHDTFVFAPNFGQVSLSNFGPSTDSITFSRTVFSSQEALAAAIHDDGSGNAVITDAAHDTISLLHVTTAQLLTHLADFHIV